MFCPVCRDEFRPGFTRCANCGVDLVESLEGRAAATEDRPARKETPTAPPVPMVEYCGFLSLDEARGARERLKQEGIRSDILIRELSGEPTEEYWLRVESQRYRHVQGLLGFDEADHAAGEGTFVCDKCGAEVAEEEHFCPSCGARFEED